MGYCIKNVFIFGIKTDHHDSQCQSQKVDISPDVVCAWLLCATWWLHRWPIWFKLGVEQKWRKTLLCGTMSGQILRLHSGFQEVNFRSRKRGQQFNWFTWVCGNLDIGSWKAQRSGRRSIFRLLDWRFLRWHAVPHSAALAIKHSNNPSTKWHCDKSGLCMQQNAKCCQL